MHERMRLQEAFSKGNIRNRGSNLKVSTGNNPLSNLKTENIKQQKTVVSNPRRAAFISRQSNIKQIKIEEEPNVPFKVRMARCRRYMGQSSLYLFHKQTRCRKKLVILTNGDGTKPLFRTVEALLEFYTQHIPDKQIKRFEQGIKAEELSESQEIHESVQEHDESGDDVVFEKQTVNDRFL